jgi:hypothetical protein
LDVGNKSEEPLGGKKIVKATDDGSHKHPMELLATVPLLGLAESWN